MHMCTYTHTKTCIAARLTYTSMRTITIEHPISTYIATYIQPMPVFIQPAIIVHNDLILVYLFLTVIITTIAMQSVLIFYVVEQM